MSDARGLRERKPEPKASSKLLRGFAISRSQKIETSYEYLMGAMRADHRCHTFRLDLITGEMWPKTCEERRNRILADMIIDNWAYLRPRFPRVTFTRAELVSRWLEPETDERRIETRVTFVADDGRRWAGTVPKHHGRASDTRLISARYRNTVFPCTQLWCKREKHHSQRR